MAIRSGRFRVKPDGSDIDHTIVSLGDKGKGGAFYRILNSGKDPLTLKYQSHSSGNLTHTVLTEQSFDLYVKASTTVIITVTDGTTAEGIYDFLGDGTTRSLEEVRSGRFKIADGSALSPVADFGGSNKATGYYRFFNSGAESFKILTAGSVLVAKLEGGNSADVSATLRKNLQVQHGDDLAEPIEGIYDFLSGDDDSN
jgi:hypothetical protein